MLLWLAGWQAGRARGHRIKGPCVAALGGGGVQEAGGDGSDSQTQKSGGQAAGGQRAGAGARAAVHHMGARVGRGQPPSLNWAVMARGMAALQRPAW